MTPCLDFAPQWYEEKALAYLKNSVFSSSLFNVRLLRKFTTSRKSFLSTKGKTRNTELRHQKFMCSEHTQMGENILAGQAPGCNLGLDCAGRWQRTTGLWQDGCLVPSCPYRPLKQRLGSTCSLEGAVSWSYTLT